jgi:HD domain
MTSTRVLAERITEDGPAAHHRLLQHLPTLVADTAPGTAAALADRSAPDVVRERAVAVATAALLRRSTGSRPPFRLAARAAEKESSSHEAPHQSRRRPAIAGPQELPMNAVTDLGTHSWVDRTGGQLSGAERRSLLRPLARTHAVNAVGQLSMLVRLNSGRRAQVDPAELIPPSSALTRAAVEQAQRLLTPALLNHSYRTFAFGAALGALEGLTVDAELLFAAALLHDTGLPTSERNVDFTWKSARIARDVAEEVGLSSAATEAMRTAITLHHSPGVTLAHGPVAYLLSAGAGLDVVGLRYWQLPPRVLALVLEQHPRLGFKREFAAAFRAEAARVQRGRAKFLHSYGGFDLAIKLSPFRD